MNTPICDFINEYVNKNPARFHMPGHKGKSLLGFEKYDVTEIDGADSLYEASGIIKESEKNASSLFSCKTLYSTEGSSHCIRAMVYLVSLYAKQQNRKPIIAAGRNAHKTFINATALCDCDVMWLYPDNCSSYLSCEISAEKLEETLLNAEEKPVAVYLTNPDYLGNMIDIKPISEICRKHGILLMIDNAHGAYLKFLHKSEHPADLGADLCCDSAHKTLPVLTGGAYLHIADNAPSIFANQAKNALALFGSTSPSYIIMQSLDAANLYLANGYKEKLSAVCDNISELKSALCEHGYTLAGNEPLKITLKTKEYGYYAYDFANMLAKENIICEFADKDFCVLMLTPETASDELQKLKNVLLSAEKKDKICEKPPEFNLPEKSVSIRDAVFSESETVPASECNGRILACATVSCPPAVPIVVSGEIIDENAIECFRYYNVKECSVIK